jgi:hypothetical protein
MNKKIKEYKQKGETLEPWREFGFRQAEKKFERSGTERKENGRQGNIPGQID